MLPGNHTSEDRGPVHRVRRFFYADEVPYGLALMRMLLPLVLFGVMLRRWPHVRELYSADGAPAQLAFSYGWGNLLPELQGGVAVALFTVMLFCLVTASIGWCTRISLILAAGLYTYFNLLDCVGTITKYSVIASHVLLLLSLSHCGSLWSVDSRLAGHRRNRRPGEPGHAPQRFSVWPRRLIQLLIGVVYFGAAITKMHTPQFFSGDQLMFWMVTHVNNQHPLGEYLSFYPALLVAFAYVSIVWEIVFLFLAWKGWGRIAMLTLGAIFHFMTTLTLGLFVFPLVCLSTYFSFLEEDDVRNLARSWRRLRRRRGWHRRPSRSAAARPPQPEAAPRIPRPLAWGFAAILLAMLGVELEYRLDPYQLRQAQGPLPLRKLDPELVRQMIGPTQPLRPQDKFFAFDVGSMLLGENLVNCRDEFEQGETVIAQASLNPPHEDMWVECNLHDADDHVIDRVGAVVSREMLRCNYFYQLPESLAPGKYHLVLMNAGREITRRTIQLNSRVKSPVAN